MIVAADPGPLLAVRSAIDAHVAAELTSDPATIVATIAGTPFFPALVRGVDGRAALELLTDTAAVREFYRARLGTFEIVDTTRIAELRSDWYALHESVATVRHVGDYLAIAPAGATHRVHSVVLFPVAHDGIVGELEWTHVDFARIFAGTATVAADEPTFVPTARLDAAALHDAVLTTWLAGDAAGVERLTGPIAWASRHVHVGALLPDLCRAATGDGLAVAAATFARVVPDDEPVRLQRLAASWYSFVEVALRLAAPDGPRTIRLASLLALQDGRPTGHLAYSVDTTPRPAHPAPAS